MNKLIVCVSLVMLSLQSFAAQVLSARFDSSREYILVEVSYGGGCKPHQFNLKMNECMETFPVQCSAELQDLTKDDDCTKKVHATVVLPLSKYKLNDSNYKGAYLTITGDKNPITNKTTYSQVTLP